MKTKLFILFAIIVSLLFSNCQTEDNAIDDDTHSKFSMKRISFEEMKSKPKAVEASTRLEKPRKLLAHKPSWFMTAPMIFMSIQKISSTLKKAEIIIPIPLQFIAP